MARLFMNIDLSAIEDEYYVHSIMYTCHTNKRGKKEKQGYIAKRNATKGIGDPYSEKDYR